MFYKNKIENIEGNIATIYSKIETLNKYSNDTMDSCVEHEKKLNEQKDRLNIHGDKIEEIQTELKSINEKIDAIIECIRGDRKDINALINIYKAMKPQTKRKK